MSDTQPASDLIGIEEFARVKLKIATIREVLPHPRADKLLVLKVDLGGEDQRQLVAGIKNAYQPEDLVGRQIVVVSNLQPATLRGERSEGMLLAASDGSGEPVLLSVEKPVENGAQVR